jgi:hypothetical protein
MHFFLSLNLIRNAFWDYFSTFALNNSSNAGVQKEDEMARKKKKKQWHDENYS